VFSGGWNVFSGGWKVAWIPSTGAVDVEAPAACLAAGIRTDKLGVATIEASTTGRSKCLFCNIKIAKLAPRCMYWHSLKRTSRFAVLKSLWAHGQSLANTSGAHANRSNFWGFGTKHHDWWRLGTRDVIMAFVFGFGGCVDTG
jgi:hypothetical protein